jgi:predicted AAA+ superfamily ATPase
MKSTKPYTRALQTTLQKRLKEPRKFIQVIVGPRQVGKTTLATQLFDSVKGIKAFHSADDVSEPTGAWIDQVWQSLRVHQKLADAKEALLVVDEIQKIKDWSATVKKNWDRDTREKRDIKLLLLGSSRTLLMDGLSESLTGRYELSHLGHWSFPEMHKAFGFSAEEYMWFGGYPGAATFRGDEPRFKSYIRDSIVEPTMTRDILLTTRIDKPALLRQLYTVASAYSTQIVSYNKMLGQLQDAGNTTTLARYLQLLGQAGLLSGLEKASNRAIESKGSIPKLQIQNTALLSAASTRSFEEALVDPALWGTVFESSVGAYLVEQASKNPNAALYYWREGRHEVDYVLTYGEERIGIEVKRGDESIPEATRTAFLNTFPDARLLLVGRHGIPYETFMNARLEDWVALG